MNLLLISNLLISIVPTYFFKKLRIQIILTQINTMKKALLYCLLSCTSIIASAQQIEFEEYDLDNGLHVILHQDNSTPIIVTSVLYHVGFISSSYRPINGASRSGV